MTASCAGAERSGAGDGVAADEAAAGCDGAVAGGALVIAPVARKGRTTRLSTE